LAKGRSTITAGETAREQAMRYPFTAGRALFFSDNDELFVSRHRAVSGKATLSAGESGLGIRLLAAVCAANNGVYRIDGDGSLKPAPMTFLGITCPLFGASCDTNDGKFRSKSPARCTAPGGSRRIDQLAIHFPGS